MKIDIASEAERLRKMMDEIGCVNIFLSEGAGVEEIVADMEGRGVPVIKDPFGHPKLDAINVGAWFAEQFPGRVGAEKVLVQKSGYFARSAPANQSDLLLIKSCVDHAVECALRGESGLIGHDGGQGGRLRAIEFERGRGRKRFDIDTPWIEEMLSEIGQPRRASASAEQ